MRIGVIFAAYNCEEFVDSCLTPWFKMRDSFDVILTCTSGRFSDYQRLGIPNKNKETLKKLVSWDLDYLSITGGEKLLDEDTSRNRCLDYLKPYNCDLIWLVDLDEIYAYEQISLILDYVESNPETNNFLINFKNYTIKYPLFLPWKRLTLYRNNIRGGIRNFYFDSYFSYADGSTIEDETRLVVPREFAFVDHFSWISRDAVRDKIQYQNKRYVGSSGNFPENLRCSFIWDGERNKLDFNKDYWTSIGGTQIPILREKIGEKYALGFDLDFDRNQNTLNIFNYKLSGKHEFIIRDSKGQHVFTDYLDLYPGVNYWILPSSYRIFDAEPETYYIDVSVNSEDESIHSERLHLKI